ncbi:hypothetical protein F4604DRAFT_1932896 [Suillus subluteus]|nr:hypothetical protein F4604DRAFT_1932896 [Suillus subluteus]
MVSYKSASSEVQNRAFARNAKFPTGAYGFLKTVFLDRDRATLRQVCLESPQSQNMAEMHDRFDTILILYFGSQVREVRTIPSSSVHREPKSSNALTGLPLMWTTTTTGLGICCLKSLATAALHCNLYGRVRFIAREPGIRRRRVYVSRCFLKLGFFWRQFSMIKEPKNVTSTALAASSSHSDSVLHQRGRYLDPVSKHNISNLVRSIIVLSALETAWSCVVRWVLWMSPMFPQ